MGLCEFPGQLEHPRDIVHAVVDMQRKAQHAAPDRELHTILDEMLVESVAALVPGAVMIVAHRAYCHYVRKMRPRRAPDHRQAQIEEPPRPGARKPRHM